jgi:hypothetical protein
MDLTQVFGEMKCSQTSAPVLIALALFAIDVVQILLMRDMSMDVVQKSGMQPVGPLPLEKESKWMVLLQHVVGWAVLITLLGVLSGKCYDMTAWAILLVPFVVILLSVIVFVSVWSALVAYFSMRDIKKAHRNHPHYEPMPTPHHRVPSPNPNHP